MSNEVEVKYGDNAAGTASRLLAAASELELHPSVVKTTSDSVFLVPEEVADKAGLSYDVTDAAEASAEPEADVVTEDDDKPLEVPEGELEDRLTWVSEGEDESERTKRANAVWSHGVDSGSDEAALEDLKPQLHTAVHGDEAPQDETDDQKADEPLIGKALDKALEDAGLSKSGNKAAKQARLAEHKSKE